MSSLGTRRVVVTGLGMLSALGLSVGETWGNLLESKSGVRTITTFDTSLLPVKFSASVKDFDVSPYLTYKEARKIEPFIQFAVAAAHMAVEDSGMAGLFDSHRAGVAIGSGIGGLSTIEKNYKAVLDHGPRKISPFFIPSSIINMAPGIVSMKHALRGPNISVVSACTTGAHNIGLAGRMIQNNDADLMVAGGTEMATTVLGIGGFASARALSTRNDDPESASRPWDRDRDGFVLGDGAAVLVLEELEHAKKRDATIYAELKGFGMSADAYHMTAPDESGEGFKAAMSNTLADAGLNPGDVDYINAHGTSTIAADHIEALAIKKAFKESAYNIAVSSTKSMTGHMLGAAGAAEAIFCILAIRDQIVPPTINLDNPDEGCDLDFVPHTARKMKINTVLSNSFGFGGTNGSLIFTKI